MMSIDSILTGKQPGPERILLYGTQGIGKSTFGAMAPRPIFIQTEDGIGRIDAAKFPLARSMPEVMQAIATLYDAEHEYRTIVIDSLDWLERLIWAEVCREKNVSNIEEIGYAKGYAFALTHWQVVLDGLNALRSARGMAVILLAHAKIETFANPETDSYDRFVPRLRKDASALIQEWCDEVLFATYRVFTKHTEEGFNRTRTHAIGTGERIIRTTERPAHAAKNRLSLPDELPLDWAAFASLVPEFAAIPA